MIIVTCVECGRSFPRQTNDVVCSKACRKARGKKKGLADTDINNQICERFANGDLQADIARDLGLSYAAVRMRICMARKMGILNPRKTLPKVLRPEGAWERLRAELVKVHREEFLESVYGRAA